MSELRRRLRDVIPAELDAEGADAVCRSCGSAGMVVFYEARQLPSQSCVLLETEAESHSFTTGELLLAFCERCGFIQNVRFDLDLVDYSRHTEESQAFSQRFQAFANDLADELFERHHLEGRTVLEVGCGKGDFLSLLAQRGISHGIGIDPGYLPDRLEADSTRLEFRREWYGSGHTGYTADLVVTRHLMEHVPDVQGFFGLLEASTRATPGSSLFTEVPDVLRVLREGAFWDVYYEHCSYFTPGSLASALRASGFALDRLSLGFDGQYLLADSHPGRGGREFDIEDTPAQVALAVEAFARVAEKGIRYWRDRIANASEVGPVAVWGGGSKAVAFLTAVSGASVVVVDINPHKQQRWLPTVGVQVHSPEALADVNPALVIPMNSAYTEEIRSHLGAMNLTPELEPV